MSEKWYQYIPGLSSKETVRPDKVLRRKTQALEVSSKTRRSERQRSNESLMALWFDDGTLTHTHTQIPTNRYTQREDKKQLPNDSKLEEVESSV